MLMSRAAPPRAGVVGGADRVEERFFTLAPGLGAATVAQEVSESRAQQVWRPAELFRVQAGVDFTPVPFNGAAPAQTALLAGQVDAMFQNPVTISRA